jgi:hypothetical protein
VFSTERLGRKPARHNGRLPRKRKGAATAESVIRRNGAMCKRLTLTKKGESDG